MKNNNNHATPLVKLEGVSKVFTSDDVETYALDNIDLSIAAGEYVSITGPSGCGKSTLLSLLGLLDTCSRGHYSLSGHQVADIERSHRAQIRNKEIGFIFQSFNLISDLTVMENVMLPLTYRSDINIDNAKDMAKEALDKVNLAHRANHFPSQLSGGQQQRVAIARAIGGAPSVLLADEPTGNLDSKNAQDVMALLDELHRDGATIVMVTHDPRSADQADRIVEIFDGKIVADSRLSAAGQSPLGQAS